MNALGLMKFITNSTATCVVYASDIYNNITAVHLSYFQPYTTMSLTQWRCAQGVNSTIGVNCSSQAPFITFTTIEMQDVINTTRRDSVVGSGGIPHIPTTTSILAVFLQILYWLIGIFIVVMIIRFMIYFAMNMKMKKAGQNHLLG